MCCLGSRVFRKGYGPNPPCHILLFDPVIYCEFQRLNNPSEERYFISPYYHLSLLVTLACVGVILCVILVSNPRL